MNNSNLESKERWVCCPVCGRKVQRSWISVSDCNCSCGAEFTSVVTKDFVTTILHEKGENISMQERITQYMKQLQQFALQYQPVTGITIS